MVECLYAPQRVLHEVTTQADVHDDVLYVNGLPKGAPLPRWVKPELLPAIQVPTLLIHGRDDRVVSFETSLYLLANIPDSRLVLLNRCGHWAMIEHADEFNRLVADFIANN
ncbi:alpha/beta hydrolase [Streptosporangium canum]|uniref:alpha/beta fold hydrolase n=1 Tax=Streptosporangium canum TaxID=324952 RepID=UPI00342CCF60